MAMCFSVPATSISERCRSVCHSGCDGISHRDAKTLKCIGHVDLSWSRHDTAVALSSVEMV